MLVPVLYHALAAEGVDPAVRMHLAVGTSLATLAAASWQSGRAHAAQGGVDAATLRAWTPWVIAGAIAGAVLARPASAHVLQLVFGTVSLSLALRLWLQRPPTGDPAAVPPPRHTWLGLPIGLISTLMGIGGGGLSVAALSLGGVPMRVAVGTAAMLGFYIAVPATLGLMVAGAGVPGRPPGSIGFVSLVGVAALAPLQMLTVPWGARLAHRWPRRRLQLAFMGFLLLSGSKMLWEAFSRPA